MITIPTNTVLQSKGLGDTIGDIVESFNLDLSTNYGAIRATRSKRVPVYNAMSYYYLTQRPVAIQNFIGEYYFVTEDYIFKGGVQPADRFDNVFNDSNLNESQSDMKIFNSKLYASAGTFLVSSADGASWTNPAVSGLTSSPHLMEVLDNRLYISNNYTRVVSINTSDALVTSSSFTLNLATAYGLDTNWTITGLKRANDLLWITCLNIVDGRGLVFNWNGDSADVFNSVYELPSGVVSATVLDNVLYIIDVQGVLKRYNGGSFSEVARLPKKDPNFFASSMTLTNTRFIHPNGMQVTDRGTILFLLNNVLTSTYDDTIPAGIWEYDSNIGLYHKYSVSSSVTTATTYSDGGQGRISQAGALYTGKPQVGSLTDNGSLLFGAKYFTNASSQDWGLFCDDSLNTTEKYAYFVTYKKFSSIQEQWQKIYGIYKKFINSASKIVIKYRTEEDIPTQATITFTDVDRFTTVTDISAYGVGDEIQVVQGFGAGQSAHIKEIDGSTYILDETFQSGVIGLTAIANVSHWIRAGEINYGDKPQFKALTLTNKNTSPFIQVKVALRFNGIDELNKLQIIHKPHINEE